VVAPVSILLPGLDGTAELFEPFVAAAPATFRLRPMALPKDRPRDYGELTTWVLDQLPAEPFALIAESFSGPLALLVADRCPRVTAIVLCASFVEPPLPSLLAHLPEFVWSRPPPHALLSFFLTGGDRTLSDAVHRAVASVPAAVVARRVAAALSADVTAEFERFSRPLLFLAAQLDRVIPSRCSQRARALKPSARFVEVRAPHLVLQSHPIDAWSHIAPFLERASVRDTG
jgi:pimeloyl-ACP methyl ester carboxylesterase